jgi:integrase
LTKAKGTHRNYARHVRNLLAPKLGWIKLARLDTVQIEDLYLQLAGEGHGTAKIRGAAVALRAALSWALRHKLVAGNMASGKLVPLPAHAKKEIKPLEPEQLAVFLEAAKGDRLHALYMLAVDSGMRQGEMLALVWQDVNFDKGTVTVNRSLEEIGGELSLKEPKTKKSRRTIALSAPTLAALQSHRKAMLAEGNYGPDRPVFCGARSRSWLRKSDIYRHSFTKILEKTGLDFRFHDLRHTCASWLLASGIDVVTIQQRLGHATPVMTLNTYSHILAGAQSQAAAKLGAILERVDKAKTGTAS